MAAVNYEPVEQQVFNIGSHIDNKSSTFSALSIGSPSSLPASASVALGTTLRTGMAPSVSASHLRKQSRPWLSGDSTNWARKSCLSFLNLSYCQILCSCILIIILLFHILPSYLSSDFSSSPEALPNRTRHNQTSLNDTLKSSLQVAIPNSLLRQKLHLHITTKSDNNQCGGCMVLVELYETLISFGISSSRESKKFNCADMQDIANNATAQNKTLVIVLPEGDASTKCRFDHRRIVLVHWILAPLGRASKSWSVLKSWGRNDLVYNYATSCSPLQNVPTSSILQVIAQNPDYVYDYLPLQKYNRSGVLWTMRKGKRWHKQPLGISEIFPGITERQVRKISLKDFLPYEYFLSYDPYTYYSYIAAITGAVSVVYPLNNMTKKEWLLGTYVGEYARSVDAENVPGVAWGWSANEIRYARETMGELRSFMDQARSWGKQTTVWRFLRDTYWYGEQDFDHIEGGMFVQDVYYWLLDLSEEERIAKGIRLKWCSSKKIKVCPLKRKGEN